MKRDRLFWFCCCMVMFYSMALRAQKTFNLRSYGSKNMKIYNLNGSELFLIKNSTLYFIPKYSQFTFQTNSSVDAIFRSDDTDKFVYLMIKNSRKNYQISIPRDVYIARSDFDIYIYKYHMVVMYRVDLPELDNWGFNAKCNLIRANRLWRKKSYKKI
jgi:hypothetical protein